VDKYPIPAVSDLLTKLRGGGGYDIYKVRFSAGLSVELDEESKSLTTHKSLFRSNRLSFGIASAPGLFQREMEKIF